MKLSEVVGIAEQNSAYNLQNNLGNEQWRNFVPNASFNALLQTVVQAVRNNKLDLHKSIWLHGTYGTGKSHATAVICALLSRPVDECSAWLRQAYLDKREYDQFAEPLLRLRSGASAKRLLPVYFYKLEGVSNASMVEGRIQQRVSKALVEAGVTGTPETECEYYAQRIEQEPRVWEPYLEDEAVRSLVKSCNHWAERLRCNDLEVLNVTKEACARRGFMLTFQGEDLRKWLTASLKALREQTDYTGVLLVWDEFTSFSNQPFLLEVVKALESLAELFASSDETVGDSYELLISHPSLYSSLGETTKQTEGRYAVLTYNMEAVSALRIMCHKLKVLDETTHQRLSERFYSANAELLERYGRSGLAGAESQEQSRHNLRRLYPFHAATAYLSTAFASIVGSSSRSVFSFMAQTAVTTFLENTEATEGGALVSADMLWDYAERDFEERPDKYSIITEHYSYWPQVQAKCGDDGVRVFKGLLLLNALNNATNTDTLREAGLLLPTASNIGSLFAGTPTAQAVSKTLEWLDASGTVQKRGEDLYSVEFAMLDPQEVSEARRQLEYTYRELRSIVKYGLATHRSDCRAPGPTLTMLHRPAAVEVFDGGSSPATLHSLVTNFAQRQLSSTLVVALLLPATEAEVAGLRECLTAARNGQAPWSDTGHVCLVLSTTVFTAKRRERFLDSLARKAVCDKHERNKNNQAASHEKDALRLVQEYMEQVLKGMVELQFGTRSLETLTWRGMREKLNEDIGPSLFYAGPEGCQELREVNTESFWKQMKTSSGGQARNVLTSRTLSDLASANIGAMGSTTKLFTSAVEDDFSWRSNVEARHPLKLTCDYVNHAIDECQRTGKTFDLELDLAGLLEPPYGVWNGYVPMALVAFALKQRLGELVINSQKVEPEQMVGKLEELFRRWLQHKRKSTESLTFTFQTLEAATLCRDLVKVFDFRTPKDGDITALTQALAHINDKYNALGYPLWTLCWAMPADDTVRQCVEGIFTLCQATHDIPAATTLTELHNHIESREVELRRLLGTGKSTMQSEFLSFLQSAPQGAPAAGEENQAEEYIRGNLQGATALWTRDAVRTALMKWRYDKDHPQPTTPPDNKGDKGNGEDNGDKDDGLIPTGGGDAPTPGSNPPQDTREVVRRMVKDLSEGDGYTVLQQLVEQVDQSALELVKNNIRSLNKTKGQG